MRIKILFIVAFIAIQLSSCKSEYSFLIQTPKKIKINQPLSISLAEKNQQPFDSVQFFLDKKPLNNKTNQADISISDKKLGKHTITALVFYENKTKKIEQTVYFMATEAPKIYTCKIINTYPHDPKAYTQGLEFYNGFLYESTGRKGQSSIRKVELKTGKVLQQKDLSEEYFGEGMTIFNNQIYQLTWQAGKGFIYDLETFEQKGSFKYNKSLEGWGLTHNTKQLIKSDGTEKIWFLNPKTLAEENYIETYTNTQKVEKLNELEYINGKIFANRWELNSILIINPKSGKVEGVVNLTNLKKQIEKVQTLKEYDDVLNGIAYDKATDRLFVTGKHWSQLYEIKLVEK